ncbi:50S ribosomal protein L10 [Candidatus Dojkabacteria bacterium]|nr:50S ribosomal protein L10 [Candidatus Dojkabacteria bacterium]
MARTREQKKQLVNEYVEKLKHSKAFFVLEQNALTANQAVEIKKSLFDLDSSFNVIKNSLFKLALSEFSIEEDDIEQNPKAVVFSSDKTSESAKVIKNFIDENKDILKFQFGYIEDQKVEAEEILELATLPSYEVMLAQTIGTMNAPINGFVNVLAGTIRNFGNIVNAIKEQKEK